MQNNLFTKTFEYINENGQATHYFTETKIINHQNLEIITKASAGFSEVIEVRNDNDSIFLFCRGNELNFDSPLSKILRPFSQEIFDILKKDSN